MTTADAARELGVSSEFIRGEILAGRLGAKTTKRFTRSVYRITPQQFEVYKQTYWTTTVPRITSNQQNQ